MQRASAVAQGQMETATSGKIGEHIRIAKAAAQQDDPDADGVERADRPDYPWIIIEGVSAFGVSVTGTNDEQRPIVVAMPVLWVGLSEKAPGNSWCQRACISFEGARLVIL